MYNRTRIILALFPHEMEQGKAPKDVSGVWGGIRFDRGVSEEVSLEEAGPFAANGRVVLEPEEAEAYLEDIGHEASGEEPGPEDDAPEETGSEDEPTLEERVASLSPRNRFRQKIHLGWKLSGEELRAVDVPEDFRDGAPVYQRQMKEMSDAGIDTTALFGGQPRKEPLLRAYYLWWEEEPPFVVEPMPA